MKVKKRQYKSKRARPLKSSKAKSKAKKGSKRRVKKMRGGMSENIIPTVEIISLTNRKMFGENSRKNDIRMAKENGDALFKFADDFVKEKMKNYKKDA